MEGLTGFQLDGEESDTTSLDSSIFRFREENGRTYHAYKEGSESSLPCPGTRTSVYVVHGLTRELQGITCRMTR